jgi:spectinomycin phosphotransferase
MQRLIDCLTKHYQLNVETLTLLNVGADQNASVYKAQTQGRSAYFVKIKQGYGHDLAIDIVEFLHALGVQDVILPLKTIEGEPSVRIDGYTLIVYPFIQGEDGFSRALTDEQWVGLGKTLSRVHDLDVPASIAQRLRIETYSSIWRESLRSFYPRIEGIPVGDEVALKLLEMMRENSAVVHQLVNQAEELANTLRNEPTKFVLCHSDIHGGNVLIEQHNRIYIVDWDPARHTIMAPKERDLMFIGGGVGNAWNQPREESLFYEGYGTTKIDKRILAYYRNERVVEDMAEYCQHLLLTTEGGNNRDEMFKHFKGMFGPRGVVDIALETYDSI